MTNEQWRSRLVDIKSLTSLAYERCGSGPEQIHFKGLGMITGNDTAKK